MGSSSDGWHTWETDSTSGVAVSAGGGGGQRTTTFGTSPYRGISLPFFVAICRAAGGRGIAPTVGVGLVALGAAVGALGTLVGAGGGFVLVPLLLLLEPNEPPASITATSLLVVWANATSGSIAYARQRRIDYRSGLCFALSTLPGAIAGAVVVGWVPRRVFDILFGAALVSAGGWLLVRRWGERIREPMRGRWVITRELRDRQGNVYRYSYSRVRGVALSGAVGFLSSLLGIGGGIIHVPAMVIALHFPVHVAAATSHFVLAFAAGEATLIHVARGVLGWNEPLARGVLLAVGAVPGAQIGASLARHVPGEALMRALAAGLLFVGIRLLWAGAF